VSVVRVAEDNEAVLGYVASIGLMPGVHVRVAEVAPFDGPLMVEVGGREHAIARDVAGVVFVEVES
jgi:DtxR family Mn-dependent transcriptional regulator